MLPDTSRRTFLQIAAGAAAVAPLISTAARAAGRPHDFDPTFGTATEALAALEHKLVSSRELTQHVFARIRKHNASLNAFITLFEEEALAQAAAADEARARGHARGALHGLPVLLKDCLLTAGIRMTSGSPQYASYVPTEDAVVWARLKAAGAILIGKTSLSENAGDWQTFNPLIGRTNNPWDLTRTPGGSTGGGAVALATGMGFLETGSDLAGSIRTPAGFCGVYGHKPSNDLVPLFGHVPPPPNAQLWTNFLTALGPLARSAEDLRLSLSVLGGPLAPGLSWKMVPPRKTKLRDYRLGFLLDDPYCPVEPEVRAVLEGALDALRAAGVTLVEGLPAGVTLQAMHQLWGFMVNAMQGNAVPAERRAQLEEQQRQGAVLPPAARGLIASHYDYTMQDRDRLVLRDTWARYFREFDGFLMPVTFLPAFPHDPSMPMDQRMLPSSRGPRVYNEATRWVAPATLTGLPATAAPVGRTPAGLPVSLQILGPYLEDGTPIDIAQQLAERIGGFTPPPAYAD